MVTNRRTKLINKILKNEEATSSSIPLIENAIIKTVKSMTNELLEESTSVDFGDSDRGEQFLEAVPLSTIIRIRDEWLE